MKTCTIPFSDLPLKIEIETYSPGDPGRFSGLPENCYPPEPEEVEFTASLFGTELDLMKWPEKDYDNLRQSVLDQIHEGPTP